MKETPPNKLLVSVPLDILVASILGDNHYTPVHPLLAELILLKCHNKHTAYVQLPGDHDVDILGYPISNPILWQLARWYESTERWQRAKLRAEDERKARFVAEANVGRITRFLMKTSELDAEHAGKLALKWVTNNDEAKYIRLGGKPFIKTIDEI